MLAWEGSQKSHYLAGCYGVHEKGEEAGWRGSVAPIPLYQGVGEWTDDAFFEATRYYTVHHLPGYDSPDLLSDEERLSGAVTIREAHGAPVEAIVRIFDATGSPTNQGGVGEKIDDGVYRIRLRDLTPGLHEFHAELCNVWDDLGAKETGARPSGGGFFRTPSVYFEVPGELPHHFTGLRISREVEYLDVMALVAELAIHDSKGRKVLTWKGESDRQQGSSLFIPTDERGDDGNFLPGGKGRYEARLTTEFEWRGETKRECIAHLELPSFGRSKWEGHGE